MATGGPVVVGVDGSEQSVAALAWAVGEAELRQADVHVVVINDSPSRDHVVLEMVKGITDRFRDMDPATEISEKIARGRPATQLIRLSTLAQLVVVGARGRGTAAEMLLGSVSTKVATRAHCPVVVVREYRTRGPVLVGVDGSPHSQTALQFAFDAAAVRQAELAALHGWEAPGEECTVVLAPPEELDEARSDARRSLEEQLSGWDEKYPDVTLRKHTPRGHPVMALSERTRDAQLLVVGHRSRRGLFAGLLLGSVTFGVLHHAQCPVAVIRSDEE